MNPIGTQQQQQQQHHGLSIEQFLRAAKLLEKHAIESLMVAQQPNLAVLSLLDTVGGITNSSFPSPAASSFQTAKLGEDYQKRLLMPKMHGNMFAESAATTHLYAPNSTGSSRRSSPLSAAPSPNYSPSAGAGRAQHFCLPNEPPTPTTSASSSFRADLSNNSSPSMTRGGGGRGTSRQSRAAHNELEKNRRANLRGHLEALKAALPPETDSQRDTTLSLLTRARNHIRSIKEQKAELAAKRAYLLAEHLRLQGIQKQQQQQNNIIQQQLAAAVFASASNVASPKAIFDCPASMAAAAPLEKHQPMTSDKDDLLMKLLLQHKPNRDLLEMQGLLPLLPQLYPYTDPAQALVAAIPNHQQTSATTVALPDIRFNF